MSFFKRAQASEDKRAHLRPERFNHYNQSDLAELSEPERDELDSSITNPSSRAGKPLPKPG